MFMDELERLDHILSLPPIVSRIRRTAYFQFRDPTEPVDRIGHSAPRRRRPLATAIALPLTGNSYDRRPKCEPRFPRSRKNAIPVSVPVMRREPVASDFLKWTCVPCGRAVFMWADSGDPENCPDCGSTQLEGRRWAPRRV